MVSWGWIPVSFLIRAVIGAFLIALVVANRDDKCELSDEQPEKRKVV